MTYLPPTETLLAPSSSSSSSCSSPSSTAWAGGTPPGSTIIFPPARNRRCFKGWCRPRGRRGPPAPFLQIRRRGGEGRRAREEEVRTVAGVGSAAPVPDLPRRSRIRRSRAGSAAPEPDLPEEGDGPRAPARRPASVAVAGVPRARLGPAGGRVLAGGPRAHQGAPRGLREGGEEGAPGGEQALGNGRRRRIWREEGGRGEQAMGDGRRRRGMSEREHGGRGRERKSHRDLGKVGQGSRFLIRC